MVQIQVCGYMLGLWGPSQKIVNLLFTPALRPSPSGTKRKERGLFACLSVCQKRVISSMYVRNKFDGLLRKTATSTIINKR